MPPALGEEELCQPRPTAVAVAVPAALIQPMPSRRCLAAAILCPHHTATHAGALGCLRSGPTCCRHGYFPRGDARVTGERGPVCKARREGCRGLVPTVTGASLLWEQQPPPGQTRADFTPFQPSLPAQSCGNCCTQLLPRGFPMSSLPTAQFLLVAPYLESVGKQCEQRTVFSLPPRASSPLSAARKRQINKQCKGCSADISGRKQSAELALF